jgi:GNAT superfamily N-acetyltransferase
VLSLDSLREGRGVGTALLEMVKDAAREAGCDRIRLITTNDNLDALRFYQKRGFVLVALHRDAVTAARALKPSIPLLGDHGIPIRDELDLEFPLSP